ncbi:MAG: DEAD/DEAH box helicase, partial [Planctomycetota bacterium]
MTTFASLDLSPGLLKTLADRGYHTPTPIQAECIPHALAGRDLLGCAQTGTGKTAAFALPLIQRLAARGRAKTQRGKAPARKARALILAPTRELAGQIEQSLETYGSGSGLRQAAVYGGVKQHHQVRRLRAGVDVIVATPGRLLDLIDQGYVDLSGVETFVLDEADRMLDMGFIEPIRQIGRRLPQRHQTLFFSATMAPETHQLADTMLRNPVSIAVAPVASTAPQIDQSLYHVRPDQKNGLLNYLLDELRVERAVVFTKTKHGAEKLSRKLDRSGMSSGAIHGNRTQAQRQRALDAFRAGRFRVLVATDVAARGLDVDGITHVFNYNLPNEAEAYVHRIGRTGRAGADGRAISFCSRDERGYLRGIERLIGREIDVLPMPALCADTASSFTGEPRPEGRDSASREGEGQDRARPKRRRSRPKVKGVRPSGKPNAPKGGNKKSGPTPAGIDRIRTTGRRGKRRAPDRRG